MKKCGLTRSQQTQKYIKKTRHHYGMNVRNETFYVWSEYAKSKGVSLYALFHELMNDAIEAEGFVPEISYEDFQKLSGESVEDPAETAGKSDEE